MNESLNGNGYKRELNFKFRASTENEKLLSDYNVKRNENCGIKVYYLIGKWKLEMAYTGSRKKNENRRVFL